MKTENRESRSPKSQFTFEEHLRVQLAIEQRAHQLWLLRGCRLPATLQDWLEAEREITTSFFWSRFNATPAIPAPGRRRKLRSCSSPRNHNLKKSSVQVHEEEVAP